MKLDHHQTEGAEMFDRTAGIMCGLALVCFIFALSPLAFAGGSCGADRCTGKIEAMDLRTTQLSINLAGFNNTEALDCDHAGYIRLASDNPAFKEFYSMVLAAFVSGKTLTMVVKKDGYCQIDFLKLSN